ncbi:uncharacterized protein TRAVEDRAFT_87436, partial [Trametes versicolor FP-101664 SS1]
LSEAEIVELCHKSPDDPARVHGFTLRKTLRARRGYGSPSLTAMKRASSVSILSGLGVPIPPPKTDVAEPEAQASGSPTNSQKGPNKLRNFFGQRPPSELITTHLAAYFPFTEKKVLERTRRQSMMRQSGVPGRRDSIISFSMPSQSRFSV